MEEKGRQPGARREAPSLRTPDGAVKDPETRHLSSPGNPGETSRLPETTPSISPRGKVQAENMWQLH